MEVLQRLKKDKGTRNKLILTFIILFALLIGYRIPLPGINREYLQSFFETLTNSGVGGFVNAVTGSSLANMSIFALSVAPYITASIILQLLAVVVPSIEAMSKDGSVGRQKMKQLTFIIGGVVAAVQAVGMSLAFGKNGLFTHFAWYMVLYASLVWTAGACFLIWVGQYIEDKLIGKGISMILVFNILTTLPGEMTTVFTGLSFDKPWYLKIVVGVVMAIVVCLVFAYVVILEKAEKRIAITNSGKAGMRMSAANNNVLPLKLNMGGVMPIIFSSSIMSFPVLIAQFVGMKEGSVASQIMACFNQGNWFDPRHPIYTLGLLLFIPITFVFSYFYYMISFNAKDIADNLRKNGSVINGIRPGQPTAEYLDNQAKSMLWIGTTMLVVIALFPTLISGMFNLGAMGFGGTTIIIVVGTVLEMKNTIYAQTSSVAYKSLIRKGKK